MMFSTIQFRSDFIVYVDISLFFLDVFISFHLILFVNL